jgi:hypothetical protein
MQVPVRLVNIKGRAFQKRLIHERLNDRKNDSRRKEMFIGSSYKEKSAG